MQEGGLTEQPSTFCYIAPSRILLKNTQAIAFADSDPVAAGHTLVAPSQHVLSINQLPVEKQKALWGFVGEVCERVLKDFRPDSFYIGFKNGSPPGQTGDHAHIPIIPCQPRRCSRSTEGQQVGRGRERVVPGTFSAGRTWRTRRHSVRETLRVPEVPSEDSQSKRLPE